MKKAIAVCIISALLLAVGCAKKAPEAPAPQAAVTTEGPAPQAAVTTEGPAVSEPAQAPAAPAGDYAFAFTARTLDGKEVTEAFFGQYDITMMNVWASWCGPCCNELPDLGELYGKLPENVGFLSVTIDDPEDLGEAQALLQENGCAFPCLDGQASPGLTENVINQVMAIPTTLFFDRNGNQVGTSILGAPERDGFVVEGYLYELQARLVLLNAQ